MYGTVLARKIVIIFIVGIKIFKLSGVNIYADFCKVTTGSKIKIVVATGYPFRKKTVKGKFYNDFLADTANRSNGIADIRGNYFIVAGSKAVIVDYRENLNHAHYIIVVMEQKKIKQGIICRFQVFLIYFYKLTA